jgi:hypothetical protein
MSASLRQSQSTAYRAVAVYCVQVCMCHTTHTLRFSSAPCHAQHSHPSMCVRACRPLELTALRGCARLSVVSLNDRPESQPYCELCTVSSSLCGVLTAVHRPMEDSAFSFSSHARVHAAMLRALRLYAVTARCALPCEAPRAACRIDRPTVPFVRFCFRCSQSAFRDSRVPPAHCVSTQLRLKSQRQPFG